MNLVLVVIIWSAAFENETANLILPAIVKILIDVSVAISVARGIGRGC